MKPITKASHINTSHYFKYTIINNYMKVIASI
nr:MAG TPA: hypothetical protein [Caudoviricetes sp.]DAI37894.1 MAG TPA: hypothetical protein [Caudoviricetes sp.]DAI99099.1 MAG TPA: hypothetical protein [Caudoviricetes sp.]